MNKLRYLIIVLGINLSVQSYESDQYSALFYKLKDSTKNINSLVNMAIKDVAFQWRGKRDDRKFARRVGRYFSSRQLELLVNNWDEDHARGSFTNSVYVTGTYWNGPILRHMGIAKSINLAGVYVGADKLSHFFGVGSIYHSIYTKELLKGSSQREATLKAIDFGLKTEQEKWGEKTTGIFSNADLVSNYEGLLFFRSINEDEIILGKKSIIKWEGDIPLIQREFDFKDHVHELWNEAYFPSRFRDSLARKVFSHLKTYCATSYYKENSSIFYPKKFTELFSKYSLVTFKLNQRFLLKNVCFEFDRLGQKEKRKFLSRMRRKIYRAKKLKGGVDRKYFYESTNNFNKLWYRYGESRFSCSKGKFKEYFYEHQKIYKYQQKRINELFEVVKAYHLESKNGLERWKKIDDGVFTRTDKRGSFICFDDDLSSIKERPMKVKTCFEQKKDNFNLKQSYYIVKSEENNNYIRSNPNLYKLHEPLGYIYRSLPLLCKWY